MEAVAGRERSRPRCLKSVLGELKLTGRQAQRLGVRPRAAQSPLLERLALLIAANESYERGEEDLALFTGVALSDSTLRRLALKAPQPPLSLHEPEGKRCQPALVSQVAVDGGKVCLRLPGGCQWKDYKVLTLNGGAASVARFADNEGLVERVNALPLDEPLLCLGDGHAGVWNIIASLGNPRSRFEVLDWYHLKENLYRQPWSKTKLRGAETQLWQGRAGEIIASLPSQNRLRRFLEKQQTRLVDYEDFQRAGVPIGSGAVESAIKQIGARIKVTGARWKKENVNSALANRLAYLNSKQMQN